MRSRSFTIGSLPSASGETSTLAIDLNFLPDRYRRRRVRVRAVLPALAALALAALLIPLGQQWNVEQIRFREELTALQRVQGELRSYEPLVEERAGLEARIEAARAAALEIEAAYELVSIQRVLWNQVLAHSLAEIPQGIALISVSQSGDEVVFEGFAGSYTLPSVFADRLDRLNDYSEASIESLARVDPPPTEEGGEAEATLAAPTPAYHFAIVAVLPAADELSAEAP